MIKTDAQTAPIQAGAAAQTKNVADSPDYRCPAYCDMEEDWKLCKDIKGATKSIRASASAYLPRFESESVKDWEARVNMTFVDDHYPQTKDDLVGLVFAGENPVKLDKDVPAPIVDLWENIDGEGSNGAVFAQALLDAAIDHGHAVLITDYPRRPDGQRRLTIAEAKAMKMRPYWCMYTAPNVLSWRIEKIGGEHVIVQIVFREYVTVDDGQYGTKEEPRYRVYHQAVARDPMGRPVRLGAVTFELLKEVKGNGGVREFIVEDEGYVAGQDRIPMRIVYAGEKLGILHTRPFLVGLAYSNLEETQVKSEYSAVMHKCNVPTPIFIGRNITPGVKTEVQMGQGIDIPAGGDAKMLEPQGVAIEATERRIDAIRKQMQRQGATPRDDGAQMTAKEAGIVARRLNARMVKASQSLQDALEGGSQDIARFLGLPSGGSVVVNADFANGSFDPLFLAACRDAYSAGALGLEEYRHAIKYGRLPDDFDDTAIRSLVDARAEADAAKADEEQAGSKPTDAGAQPPGSTRKSVSIEYGENGRPSRLVQEG